MNLNYDKLLEKWIDFLVEEDQYLGYGIPDNEDDLMDIYDSLAEDFCKQYGYSEETLEFAFHGQWYDSFADEYFRLLEKGGWKGFKKEASMP